MAKKSENAGGKLVTVSVVGLSGKWFEILNAFCASIYNYTSKIGF